MLKPTLPTFTEVKRTLDGVTKRFACQLVERRRGQVVLLYRPQGSWRTWRVGGLDLPPGTSTLGYFWRDRPYNVYHWLAPYGQTVAFYFNLARRTHFGTRWVDWEDLTVDLLVTPGAVPLVLDEDELPADLDPALRAELESARQRALSDLEAVTSELESRSAVLWKSIPPP